MNILNFVCSHSIIFFILKKILIFCLAIGAFVSNAFSKSPSTKADSSSLEFLMSKWTLSEFGDYRILSEDDTSLALFHLYEPVQKNRFLSSHIGYSYSPAFFYDSLVFLHDNPFLQSVDYNFLTYRNETYYSVTKPYTHLRYQQSANNEVSGMLHHTQNVNKDLNFGIIINHFGYDGLYSNQKVKGRRYGLNVSYLGETYFMMACAHFNRLELGESFGLQDVHDTESYRIVPDQVKVKSINAESKSFHKDVFFRQEFNLGKVANSLDSARSLHPNYSFSVGNSIIYNYGGRNFRDNNIIAENYIYILHDSASTADTTYLKTIENNAFVGLNKYIGANNSVKVYEKIGIEYQEFGQSDLNDEWIDNRFYNLFNKVDIRLTHKKSSLDLSYKVFYSGDKAGDMCFHAGTNSSIMLKADTVRMRIIVENISAKPNYFYRNISLNNYEWNNNYKHASNLIKAQLLLEEQRFGFEMKATVQQVTEMPLFIYDAGFVEYNSALISAVKLAKNTKLWKLGMYNSILFSRISDLKYFSIPDYLSYNSLFLTLPVPSKRMVLQFGGDINYVSEHYQPKYIPELGLFSPQDSLKISDRMFVDAFLNIYLRGVRIFVKYSHINYLLDNNAYLASYGYLTSRAKYSAGFSWRFIN